MWLRSPARQRAAMKPSTVTKAKRITNTVIAVQFIAPSDLGQIGEAGHDRGDDYPYELEPIEEGDPEQGRFDPVEERHPDGHEEGDEQDHVPDATLQGAQLAVCHGVLLI